MADIEQVRAQMAEVSRKVFPPNADNLKSIGRVFWMLLDSAIGSRKSGLEAQWFDLARDSLETSIAQVERVYSTFETMTEDEKRSASTDVAKSLASLRSSLKEYWNEREKRLVSTMEKTE